MKGIIPRPEVAEQTRDDDWLNSRFRNIWDDFYSETPVGYPISVMFGRAARYRFGSICAHGKQCKILINGLFAHPDVPEYVVDATLAHELAHYVHGYGSGLPKLHAHPHRGGVIDREMEKRGCLYLEHEASAWRKSNWAGFYLAKCSDAAALVDDRRNRAAEVWNDYLQTPGFRAESDLHTRLRVITHKFGIKEPAFGICWLNASRRRTGLSYRTNSSGVVSIHGLLADPKVPDEVLDYEISYWVAVTKVGSNWRRVETAIREAGLWRSAEKAIRWRRRVWPGYRRRQMARV